MVTLTRNVKIWIVICLFSLFAYNAWLVRGSYAILIGYLMNVPSDVNYVTFTGSVFWAGHLGLTARFAALVIGLVSVLLLWTRNWSFLKIKNFVAAALVLESLNFVGLIPSLWFLSNFSPSLEYGYLLQIVFTVPFLWALAFMVFRYKDSSQKRSLLKMSALVFVAYSVALFANEVSRWVSMISADSLVFLFEGIRGVGFINAVAVMPFAVVFALVAARNTFHGEKSVAMRWMGASLAIIGANYLVYVIYSYFADSLNYVWLVDFWTIPLLGLGLALVINSRKPDTN